MNNVLLIVPTLDSPLSPKPQNGIFATPGSPFVWDYFLEAYQVSFTLLELVHPKQPSYYIFSISYSSSLCHVPLEFLKKARPYILLLDGPMIISRSLSIMVEDPQP